MNEYCNWDHDSRQVLDDNVFIVPSLPRTLRINFTRLHTTIQDSFYKAIGALLGNPNSYQS